MHAERRIVIISLMIGNMRRLRAVLRSICLSASGQQISLAGNDRVRYSMIFSRLRLIRAGSTRSITSNALLSQLRTVTSLESIGKPGQFRDVHRAIMCR